MKKLLPVVDCVSARDINVIITQRKTVAETRDQAKCALGEFPQAMAWGYQGYRNFLKGTNSRNFFNSFFNGENPGIWGGVVR